MLLNEKLKPVILCIDQVHICHSRCGSSILTAEVGASGCVELQVELDWLCCSMHRRERDSETRETRHPDRMAGHSDGIGMGGQSDIPSDSL